MDTAGALLGPLAALALLPVFSGKVRAVFWLAAIPGAVAILLAWLAVSEVRTVGAVRETARQVPGQSVGEVRESPRASVWNQRLTLMMVAVGLFSLGNSSDLFLILRAQNLGVRAALAPGLGLLFNLVYTSLSWPAGKLSDRVPRRILVVLGYFIYAAVYLGFSLSRGTQLVWVLFAVYGTYYALTEGVLRAWIADLVPSASRGSVYGVFNWLAGVATFPASLMAGWLWRHSLPPRLSLSPPCSRVRPPPCSCWPDRFYAVGATLVVALGRPQGPPLRRDGLCAETLNAPSNIEKDHPYQRSERVDATVLNGGGPAGHEALVVFIGQRKEAGNDYRADGASCVPAFRLPESEGMVEKQRQHAIFGAMCELADQKVNDLESRAGKMNVYQRQQILQEPARHGGAVGSRGEETDIARPGKSDSPGDDHAWPQIGGGLPRPNLSRASNWGLPW
jgi:hypothetical protein